MVPVTRASRPAPALRPPPAGGPAAASPGEAPGRRAVKAMGSLPISVVIPVYNALDRLPATVASACGQSARPQEIVVVDDGSPEGSASQVLADAGLLTPGPVPVRVERQPNGGPSRARNRGIELARAPWIAFLDGDDLWEPDKLWHQWQAVAAHPDAVVVSTSWRRPHVPRPDRAVPPARPQRHAVRQVAWLNRFQTSTVLAAREALRAAGPFDPAMDGLEDWDMWLRLVAQGQWVHIPFPLVLYADSPQGVSKNTDRAYRAGLRRLGEYRSGVGDPRIAAEVTPRLLTWHHLRFAFSFHRLGEADRRAECLRAAWRPGARLRCIDVAVRNILPFLAGRVLARRRGAPSGRAP